MKYQQKINEFVDLININSDNKLLYLIKSVFFDLEKIDSDNANKTLDALISIAKDSLFSIKYSDRSCFEINYSKKNVKINLLKNDDKFALVHEFEHIIHYYGARCYDKNFINELMILKKDDIFLNDIKEYIESSIVPRINQCNGIRKSINNDEKSKLKISVDNNIIKDYMIDHGYSNEMISFVINNKISLGEFFKSFEVTPYIMKNLYPEYFYLFAILQNILKGEISKIIVNLPFTCGHTVEYFKTKDDVMWFSEIISTYAQINFADNNVKIKSDLKDILGNKLYSKLNSYSNNFKELTIERFNNRKGLTK